MGKAQTILSEVQEQAQNALVEAIECKSFYDLDVAVRRASDACLQNEKVEYAQQLLDQFMRSTSNDPQKALEKAMVSRSTSVLSKAISKARAAGVDVDRAETILEE